MQIRLDDIHATILNRPPETPHAKFLLATGHGSRHFIRHTLGIPDVIERARLFKKSIAIVFHETANADGMFDIIGTVGISIERHLVAERTTHEWDQGLGSTGQRIPIIAHATTESKLDCTGAGFGNQAFEVFDFLLRTVTSIAAGAINRNVAS